MHLVVLQDVVIPVYISAGHFAKFGFTRSPIHPLYPVRARVPNEDQGTR